MKNEELLYKYITIHLLCNVFTAGNSIKLSCLPCFRLGFHHEWWLYYVVVGDEKRLSSDIYFEYIKSFISIIYNEIETFANEFRSKMIRTGVNPIGSQMQKNYLQLFISKPITMLIFNDFNYQIIISIYTIKFIRASKSKADLIWRNVIKNFALWML